jgi:hypothetical protein
MRSSASLPSWSSWTCRFRAGIVSIPRNLTIRDKQRDLHIPSAKSTIDNGTAATAQERYRLGRCRPSSRRVFRFLDDASALAKGGNIRRVASIWVAKPEICRSAAQPGRRSAYCFFSILNTSP